MRSSSTHPATILLAYPWSCHGSRGHNRLRHAVVGKSGAGECGAWEMLEPGHVGVLKRWGWQVQDLGNVGTVRSGLCRINKVYTVVLRFFIS